MNWIYETAGFSRQAHWDFMSRHKRLLEKKEALRMAVLTIRELHPGIGGKKLYWLLKPDFMGRDLFFDFLGENNILIVPKRSRTKTTFSTRSHWFPNLIPGLEIWDMDMLWVSDITYFKVEDQFYYLTFVMDVYSRRIIGYNASPDLRAESNVLALRKALQTRNQPSFGQRLIHHSDQGVQYASFEYTDLLKQSGIKISMSSNVLENAHVERVNGTIKNAYLNNWKITGYQSLTFYLKKAVEAYNQCPHWGLEFQSPELWEKKCSQIPREERRIMKLYFDPQNKPCNQTLLFEHKN